MNRRGFTLIELLIVVVIIGILAAIAIPKFANTKEKAILASLKSDLRNLVTAEEAYFAENSVYATVTGPTQTATAAAFQASKGNTIVIVAGATLGSGWAATATNAAVAGPPSTCGIFVGTGTAPDASITIEGAPGCY